MPTLLHEQRIDGDFKELVAKATNGEVIELCRAQENDHSYSCCKAGVLEHVQGAGFYLNGVLTFPYTGKCQNYFPYLEEFVIVEDGQKVFTLTSDGTLKMIYEGNAEFIPHIDTETVLVLEDKRTILLKKTEKEVRKWKKFGKIPLPLWEKKFVTEHVNVIAECRPFWYNGHPDGPVLLTDGEYALYTPEKKIIHKAVGLRKASYATRHGMVFYSQTSDSDKYLVFNERDNCWTDQFDEIYPVNAPCGFVVLNDNALFRSGDEKPFKEVLYGQNEISRHPSGLLVDHGGTLSVIVVK